MAISLIIPAVFVALIVLIVAGSKIQPTKGGSDMIKNVYVYLVLFATLMMVIGGSVASFMAIADIVAPAPYYQSFEDYKRWGNERPYLEDGTPAKQQLSDEELRKNYDAMVLEQKGIQVERAKNTLVKSLGWIVIPLPVFIYFQRRLANKEAYEEV